MRFTIQHPTDTAMKAVYGFDPTAVGYFVEVRRAGKLVCAYDGLHFGQTSITGVLSRLVDHTLVTEDEVAEAQDWLPHMDAEDIEDPDVRRAATVIENLLSAAAKG